MSNLDALLAGLHSDSIRRGRQFEGLCKWFLENDPVYCRQVRRVWHWSEWPGRWGADAGIDLVVEAHSGDLWAVQAKAYDERYSITKKDVDTFLSESSRTAFQYRLLIATTDRLGATAERTIRSQEKPVGLLLRHDLRKSDASWPKSFNAMSSTTTSKPVPKQHQEAAVEDVIRGLAVADRGQLIMACGTGKTLTALWISERLSSEATLLLVPSLSLLKQTIREWTKAASKPFTFLPVCSDDTVRDRDQVVSNLSELGYPATGDPAVIRKFLASAGPKVVFGTYQSSPLIAEAMKNGFKPFDLIIADEAHRLCGPASGAFGTVLSDEKIPSKKRVFMTATPRYFTGRARTLCGEEDFEVASMDDLVKFGAILHELTFADAIDKELLCDYRVLIVAVDEQTVKEYADHRRLVTRNGHEVEDARTLASQIALAKSMQSFGLNRVVSFHSRIAGAKHFCETFAEVVDWMPQGQKPDGALESHHVTGEMPTSKRDALIQRLRHTVAGSYSLLANARCLTEGVDVPSLDGVAFVDPRRSQVDIVQAVGRAIRLAPDKKLGMILVPVFLTSMDDLEHEIDKSGFEAVFEVLRALRSHDLRLAEEIDGMRREMGRRPGCVVWNLPNVEFDLPSRVGEKFAEAIQTVLLEGLSSGWEEHFGALELFKEQFGHVNVHSRLVFGGLKLGQWIGDQRKHRRRGTLRLERERRLTQMGLSWDVLEAEWAAKFEELQEFMQVNGPSTVSQNAEDRSLDTWCSRQRLLYKSGRLSEDRKEKLTKIGFNFAPVDAKWVLGIQALKAFQAREGHCHVPRRHVEGSVKLGAWVNAKRMGKSDGSLSTDKEAALLEIGLDLSPGVGRDDLFEQLKEYKREHGNCLVPKRYVPNPELGQWVLRQRVRLNRGIMSAETKDKLDSLGFEWSAIPFRDGDLSAKEIQMIAFLKEYVAETENADVPSSCIYREERLGSWVAGCRSKWKQGRLKSKIVFALMDIGVPIDPQSNR